MPNLGKAGRASSEDLFEQTQASQAGRGHIEGAMRRRIASLAGIF